MSTCPTGGLFGGTWNGANRHDDDGNSSLCLPSLPIVSAAIELQACDTLCALIDHGLGRTMHEVVQGIDAEIAHVTLFAANHAFDLGNRVNRSCRQGCSQRFPCATPTEG
jgi:hypothetical protein